MKHMLMNKAGEDSSASGGAAGSAPDIAKVLQESFKDLKTSLSKELSQLNNKISEQNKPAPKKQAEEREEALDILILSDPKKAVERIKSDVMETLGGQNRVREAFNGKFAELSQEYPEIVDQNSDLHVRAKELMAQSGAQAFDSTQLERAVLRAAAEKGMLPMNKRKAVREDSDDESDDGYLGSGGSGGGYEGTRNRKNSRSEKLPAATIAFAELVGLDIKNPKVTESLTKRYNERKNNWNKYK